MEDNNESGTPITEDKPAVKKSNAVKRYIDNNIENLQQQIDRQSTEIEELKPKPIAPWYTQFGIWFSILLVILMVYIIYTYYLYTQGYEMEMLPWLKQILEPIKQ
jgi:hypothetical protein